MSEALRLDFGRRLAAQFRGSVMTCRAGLLACREFDDALGLSELAGVGEREMSVWNGHCECACYHSLFEFNPFGDLERCALRPGNLRSAYGWKGVLGPAVASPCPKAGFRYRGIENAGSSGEGRVRSPRLIA